MADRRADVTSVPIELRELTDQLDAADAEARRIAGDLSDEEGARAPRPGAWSVAECLSHLAEGNMLYLSAMEVAAREARANGRRRQGPAVPGVVGRRFIRLMEPTARGRIRLPAPASIRPTSMGLQESLARFLAAQVDARRFVLTNYDLDLAGVRFHNPFSRWIRFSVATGLGVIAAHNRRHLLQARMARQAVKARPGPLPSKLQP